MPGVGRAKHNSGATGRASLTEEAGMPRQVMQIRVTEISSPSSFYAQIGSGENTRARATARFGSQYDFRL